MSGQKRYNRDYRDAIEPELVKVASRLGAAWFCGPPLDGWIAWRGLMIPVEIKDPAREGTAHEYRPAQRRFFSWCRAHGVRWFVWRDPNDVMRDLGGRVAA